MRDKLLFLVPALLYSAAILYLSLINLSETPVAEIGLSDKIMHAGAYFVLGLSWMFCFLSARVDQLKKNIIVVSLLAILFGIFIEVLQDRLTSYRQLDFYDIFANGIGVIVAGTAVWLLKEFLIRLKAKINSFFIKK